MTADVPAIVDVNGTNAATAQLSVADNRDGRGWTNAREASANVTTVSPGNLNFFRVIVSYIDNDGLAETVVSQNTRRSAITPELASTTPSRNGRPNLLNGQAGNDTSVAGPATTSSTAAAGNDTLNGGNGDDLLDGGNGR